MEIMNICWYKDDEIGIFFNIKPKVSMRYASVNLTKEEIKLINKKPFINNSKLEVELFNYFDDENYYFEIEEGYVWDGATIPRFFWRLIGAKTDQRFLIPSLIHDVLCENHSYINNNRYFATLIFERLLYVSKVNAFSRWIMKHSVDNAQKIIGKW